MAKKQQNIPNRRLVTRHKRPVKFMKKRDSVILFVVSALVLAGAVVALIYLQ